MRAPCTGGSEKGWEAQGLRHWRVGGGKWSVWEPQRWQAHSTPTAGRAQPIHVCRDSGNGEHRGHEKALSCCVNNYLGRHAPSLRKKQSFLLLWAFAHSHVGHYFSFSVFSLCAFLLHYLCPDLTILSATLTTTLHYTDVTLWFQWVRTRAQEVLKNIPIKQICYYCSWQSRFPASPDLPQAGTVTAATCLQPLTCLFWAAQLKPATASLLSNMFCSPWHRYTLLVISYNQAQTEIILPCCSHSEPSGLKSLKCNKIIFSFLIQSLAIFLNSPNSYILQLC